MDGFEATRALKELMNNMKIPSREIIGCTAFAMDKDVKSCLDIGMDEVLSKPVNSNKL